MSNHPGPFTITTTPHCPRACRDATDQTPCRCNEASKVAVVTLDKTLERVQEIVEAARLAAPNLTAADAAAGTGTGWPTGRTIVNAITAAGGSLSLPGGATITVESRTWPDLSAEAGFVWEASLTYDAEEQAEVVAAWNAEHGTTQTEEVVS